MEFLNQFQKDDYIGIYRDRVLEGLRLTHPPAVNSCNCHNNYTAGGSMTGGLASDTHWSRVVRRASPIGVWSFTPPRKLNAGRMGSLERRRRNRCFGRGLVSRSAT